MQERKKILFLTSRIPYPLEKGDKLRAYHQIRFLNKNHDVYLCVVSTQKLNKDSETELNKIVKGLYVYQTKKSSILLNLMVSVFSGMPLQVGFFFNSGAHYFINQIIKKIKPDHLFVQLLRMSEYVKGYPEIPKTLDYMDSFSMGMQRRKEKASGIKKWFFSMENKRLVAYEKNIFSYFNHHFIISDQDKKTLNFPGSENIQIVPNGVDDTFFTPKKNAEKKYDLLFTGNMSYPPNVAAVELIVKKILPLIWQSKPNCTLLIAGAEPNPLVKSLASDKITVTGWMDDIRDAYNEGKIFLAPLNIGTGLQNKLLEAMSMELPCITSELANNALSAKANQEILIGATPQDYAKLVLDLIDNPDQQKELAINGKNFVVKNFHWESIIQRMERIMFSE